MTYRCSVSELNNGLKSLIDGSAFSDVAVCGEISNYKVYPSGHHYFSLKDSESSLPCVMFRQNAQTLRFKPENGMEVTAYGRISVYVRDGRYQLYCSFLDCSGEGDLSVAFEQLKKKLSEEGLFDESHKKPLPRFPGVIAVVTSPAGAAVHDIINILGSRWPLSKVVVYPVRVQGDEAPAEISAAIEEINRTSAADLIITGRGGGSAEDLWAFNDEYLAKVIYASEIPVISAVGHEPDVSISDYVADRRASTPSNAAEIAVPDIADIRQILSSYANKLNPSVYISNRRIELDRYSDRLAFAENSVLGIKKQEILKLAASLDAMSPLKVLSRGYSVVTSAGSAVRDASVLNIGDRLSIRFEKGSAECLVEETLNEF